MAKLTQPDSWTGANSSKRKTRQIGEGNNQTLSAVACVVHTYKVLRYERKRVKNNSFFVDVMIEKTVLSVKKAKEWKKKIIIEGWCFCYNGLQRFSTLHRLRLQHVLPVGVSGIISMLNLCDINEKFPNSNTWVHLSSIWLVFFSVSHLFSLPWFYLHADATWNRNLIYFHKTALILLKWLHAKAVGM